MHGISWYCCYGLVIILATEEKESRMKGKVVVLPRLALVGHIIWRVTYFRRFPRTQRQRLSPPWMRAWKESPSNKIGIYVYSANFLVHLFSLNLKYKKMIIVKFRKSNCLSCYFAILLSIMGTYYITDHLSLTYLSRWNERLYGTTFNQHSASKAVYCWKW